MSRSDAIFTPEVRKVGSRLGAMKAAWIGRVPNLPNVPNLFFFTRTYTCATRAHTHTHRVRAPVHTLIFWLGRLGRIGKPSGNAAFKIPNIFPTFPTSKEECSWKQ